MEVDRGLGRRSLYEIYSGVCTKYILSRNSTNRGTWLKTKLHPEYPHRKEMNPALKQEISVFLRT